MILSDILTLLPARIDTIVLIGGAGGACFRSVLRASLSRPFGAALVRPPLKPSVLRSSTPPHSLTHSRLQGIKRGQQQQFFLPSSRSTPFTCSMLLLFMYIRLNGRKNFRRFLAIGSGRGLAVVIHRLISNINQHQK